MAGLPLATLGLVVFCTAGCASLTEKSRKALPLYEAGCFEEAANALSALPASGGRDRLLALYQRGMILHAARRWNEANTALLEAADLAERIELIGTGEQAGNLLLNETFADYRGEDYERILCHTLAALDFLALGKLEGAQVECRRMNEVHRKIRETRGSPDRLNAFALFLSGLCWELGGQVDDATLDYRACRDLSPPFQRTIDDRLLRLSGKGRQPDGIGEVILLLEAGLAPTKRAGGPLGILPALNPRPTTVAGALLAADGSPLAPTVVLNDVEQWARKTLAEREAWLLAKRALMLAGKEVAARAVEKKKGKTAGDLTRLALLALEEPDLRSWSALPSSFQACTARLPAGKHDLEAVPVDALGNRAGEAVRFPGVEIVAGKPVVLIVRVVR